MSMDDLVVSGTIALVVLYAGIALVVYAVLLVLSSVMQAAINGNNLVLCEFFVGIAGAVLGYVLIGLWLRRTGTI